MNYISSAQAVTAAGFNEVVAAQRAILSTTFNGKDWILAHKLSGAQITNGVKTYATSVPFSVLGQSFFCNPGNAPTPYSRLAPGYVAQRATVFDETLGVDVEVEFAKPYDHTRFNIDATLQLIEQVDESNGQPRRVARVVDAPSSAFTPAMPRVGGLFDYSLNAHGRMLIPAGATEPEKYYLQEMSAPVPEKIYELAVAELWIENTSIWALPEDAQYPGQYATKFCCLRLHNLQPRSCVVLGLDNVTVGPWQCLCVRRDWNPTLKRFENQRTSLYLFNYESGDGLMFANYAYIRQGETVSDADTAADTPWRAMQGNNLANFAGFYDLVRPLLSSGLYARLHLDLHELCDVAALNKAETAAKYAAINAATGQWHPDAVIGDAIFPKGKLWIAKVHKTQNAPAPNNAFKREQWDEVQFTGFKDMQTLVATFAAKGITVRQVNGTLQLVNQSSEWSLDLIHCETHLLHRQDWAGDTYWYVLRNGANIDIAFTIDNRIFENAGINAQGNEALGQDSLGLGAFNLRSTPTFRVSQRSVAETPRMIQFYDASGVLQTLNGVASRVISDLVPGIHLPSPVELPNIHATEIRDIESLRYFGDSSRASQSDDHVTYRDSRLVLTPNGLVLKFTESVRADVFPNQLLSTGNIDVLFRNWAGTVFTYNAQTDRFEAKHAIRFRKLGFGFWQHGRIHAAYFNASHGRLVSSGMTQEVVGPRGEDFRLPRDGRAVGIKVPRVLGPEDMRLASNGERFYRTLPSYPLDSLQAIERNKNTPYWYQTTPSAGQPAPRTRVTVAGYSLNSADNSRLADTGRNEKTYLPLLAWHYNAMVELLNQLTTAEPLDWRCLVFVHGTKMLHLDPSGLGMMADSSAAWWTSAFGATLPAPKQALLGLPAGLALRSHWIEFLNEQGIPVRSGTAADLPAAWNTFRQLFNQQRTITFQCTTSFSEAVAGATRQFWDRNNGNPVLRTWSPINARVRANLVRTLGASVNTGTQGAVVVAVPGYTGPGGAANPSFTNLNTAYNQAQWVNADDLGEWLATQGFELDETEIVIPLVLDYLERPDELEDVPLLPAAPVLDEIMEVHGRGFALTNTVRDYLLACTNATAVVPVTKTYNVTSRLLAFKLFGHNDAAGAQAEWKLPVATLDADGRYALRDCYRLNHRTVGKGRDFYFQHLRAEFTSNDPFGIYNPTVYGLSNGNTNPGPGGTLTVWGNYPHINVPPWFPADEHVNWPDVNAPYVYDTQSGAGTAAAPWNGPLGLRRRIRKAGPRSYAQFAVPIDPEKLRRVENMYRYLYAEDFWYGVNVVGRGYLTVNQIGVPMWGEAQDWFWDTDDRLQRQIIVGDGAVLPTSTNPLTFEPRRVPGSAVRVDLVVGAAMASQPTEGITALVPPANQAYRLLFGGRPAVELR